MAILSQAQKDQFWRDGVLVVEDAVTPEHLTDLRRVFAGWVEESRAHTDDYGEAMGGRPRFDLQPGHNSAEVPGVRRIQSPEEVSEVYADVMRRADRVCAAVPSWQSELETAGHSDRGEVSSGLPFSAHDQ